jgi:hypothetical protein
MSYRQTIAEQSAEITRLIQLRDRCDVADFDQWVEWGNHDWEIAELSARRDAMLASTEALDGIGREIDSTRASAVAACGRLAGFARTSRRLARLAVVLLLLAVLAAQLLQAPDSAVIAAAWAVFGVSVGVGVRRVVRHERLAAAYYAAEEDYIDAVARQEEMFADIDAGRPARRGR